MEKSIWMNFENFLIFTPSNKTKLVDITINSLIGEKLWTFIGIRRLSLTGKDDKIKCSNIESSQGILSVPGIAGYKWVPARIGHFSNKKYLFLKYQRPIFYRKNRYSFVSRPCSVFPDQANGGH